MKLLSPKALLLVNTFFQLFLSFFEFLLRASCLLLLRASLAGQRTLISGGETVAPENNFVGLLQAPLRRLNPHHSILEMLFVRGYILARLLNAGMIH